MNDLIMIEKIENRIFTIRGQKIMIDSDLAEMYGVETKRINEAVKRNIERFPEDFMFQITDSEWEFLRSQIATSKEGSGGRRYLPRVFTEHGVLMLSNVLSSQKAISVSLQIIKVFVKLRQIALDYNDLPQRLSEIEKLLLLYIEKTDGKLDQQDEKISEIVYVLNSMLGVPREPKKVGF